MQLILYLQVWQVLLNCSEQKRFNFIGVIWKLISIWKVVYGNLQGIIYKKYLSFSYFFTILVAANTKSFDTNFRCVTGRVSNRMTQYKFLISGRDEVQNIVWEYLTWTDFTRKSYSYSISMMHHTPGYCSSCKIKLS